MKKSAGLLTRSRNTLRTILGFHIFWLFVVFLIGTWWHKFAVRQAERIHELERAMGVPEATAALYRARVHRMFFWETGAFYLLLFISALLLLWLYWRDYTRARSIHSFFASFTHELRTPLASIRLQAEAIADSAAGEQKALVERLLQDTMRLEGQVERSLELARLEGGGQLLTRSVEIKPWLERALANWTAYSSNHHHGRLAFELQADDVFVQADPSALEVIFRNVVENALRHSNRPSVRLCVSAKQEASSIALLFEDDGDGFSGSPRNLGNLFQKGSLSNGAGVGLYLIRTLMERMGGKASFGPRTGENGFAVKLEFRQGAVDG